MFIIEVVVGGGLVLDCIILKCVSNIPPPHVCKWKGKTLEPALNTSPIQHHCKL